MRTETFCELGLVHTDDGIGSGFVIGSIRNLPFQCESKNEDGIGIVSSTQSESEGSEGFLFLSTPLLIPSLPCKCELVDRNRKGKQKNQPIT